MIFSVIQILTNLLLKRRPAMEMRSTIKQQESSSAMKNAEGNQQFSVMIMDHSVTRIPVDVFVGFHVTCTVLKGKICTGIQVTIFNLGYRFNQLS